GQPGWIADLRGSLGLPEAITNSDSPGRAHALDHLGIQGLTGARRLAQAHAPARQVVLNQQAPYRRRGTEARHTATGHLVEDPASVEAFVMQAQNTRLRVPGGEER